MHRLQLAPLKGTLVVLLALVSSACGPMPRPQWACAAAPRLYPSDNGYIPVCPWWTERYGECFFEDVDGNGRSDLHDLEAFCREHRDGDSLTMDRVAPREDAGWCWTCD